MKTKLNFLVIITLLLGLVLSSSAQTVLAQDEPPIAYFVFTSSANPSDYRQEVTFTVEATGTHPQYQPFGYVYFYEDGNLICERGELNVIWGGTYIPDTPATCTVSSLAPGNHVITAEFYALGATSFGYQNATLTLEGGQTVNDPPAAIITPDRLADLVYGTYATQRLDASWGTGFQPDYIGWRVSSGSLPGGITLSNIYNGEVYYGELSGAPESAGLFSFTIEAYDSYWRPLGTKTYDWNINRATPVVTFGVIEKNWYGGEYYIPIFVQNPNPYLTNPPAGPVTVSIDGNLLSECTDIEPIFLGFYHCATSALGKLAPGEHTIQADFTPDTNHAPNNNSAFGTLPYNVRPRVEGLLFNDLDKDGVRDEGEELASNADVGLDLGCAGSFVYVYAFDGQFSIETSPGSEYCLTAKPAGNWRTTTELPIKFSVEGYENQYFEIGLYETVLSFSPDPLPNGSVGEFYSQEIEIHGGTGPYTITNMETKLPEGLTFDEETFTLSGTPAAVGRGFAYLEVKDSEGMAGGWYLMFYIQTDGMFTLTSDPNPSAPGQEVTFTFTGSGSVVIPEHGDDPIPPFGTVAFYAGEEIITGCEEVYLNFSDYDLMDQPAVCRTSALAADSHVIRAEFTPYPYFQIYRAATRTLTQEVKANVVAADLSITKIDKTDPVKPGAKLEYTLTITNAGPDAAQKLTLIDTLDRNTTYGSISAPKGWACKYANYQVTCTSASLAKGSSAVIKITVTVNKTAKVGKELVNNASVASETSDPNLANNRVVQKTLVMK